MLSICYVLVNVLCIFFVHDLTRCTGQHLEISPFICTLDSELWRGLLTMVRAGTLQPDLSTTMWWEDGKAQAFFCPYPAPAVALLSPLPKKMGDPGTEGPSFKSGSFSLPGQRSRMCMRSCWRT